MKNILPAKINKLINEFDRHSIITYFIFRFIVIVCMIRQISNGNFEAFFLCILSLILMCIPLFFKKILKINLPVIIEISIVVFVFCAEILGEINNFYGNVPLWDTMLHTANGFLFAAVGFGSIDMINTNSKRIQMNPLFVSAVAFCFSMTIGILWEFFEFGTDYLLRADMQKDYIISEISTVTLDPEQNNNAVIIRDIAYTNLYDSNDQIIATIDGGYLDIGIRDTMKDLAVNLVGAFTFSAFGYFYCKNRNRYKFVEYFSLTRSEHNNQ